MAAPAQTKEYQVRLLVSDWKDRLAAQKSLLETLNDVSRQCKNCFTQWNHKDVSEDIEHYVVLDTENRTLATSGFMLKQRLDLWPDYEEPSLTLKYGSTDEDVVRRNIVRPNKDRIINEKIEQDFHPCSTKFAYSGKAKVASKKPLSDMSGIKHYFPEISKFIDAGEDTPVAPVSNRYDWIFKMKGNLMKHESFSLAISASYTSFADALQGITAPERVEVSFRVEGDGKGEHQFNPKSASRFWEFYRLMAKNIPHVCPCNSITDEEIDFLW